MNEISAQFHEEIATILSAVQTLLAHPGDAPIDRTPHTARFASLADAFALNRAEKDLLQCLIAAHFDPRLRQQFNTRTGYPYVTELLIREAFGHGVVPIYASDSPLNVWRLVQARDMGPGEPLAFELEIAVLEWLAGKPGLEPRLIRRLHRPTTMPEIVAQCFDPQLRQLETHMRSDKPLICLLVPDDGADIADFLAVVSQRSQVAIWSVRAGQDPFSAEDILKIHRFVRVQNAALYWENPSNSCVDPALVPAAHLQFAARYQGANLKGLKSDHCLTMQIAAPDRSAIFSLLKSRFPDASAQIVHRAASTKGLMPRRIMDPSFSSIDAICTAQSKTNATALLDWAVPLQTTMRFDDLVLEDGLMGQLRQLVTEIDAHAELWQDPEVARVYAQERALTILLKGPPGTGKTLTARILAGEAGLPLYRVDAASLTSKYIGETAENMRALFQAANKSGAMLFIDEFEAIVGKRTETRNEIARSYNHDTAYFLQLIETQFEGVAIFATNRPAEIDEAMHRRIRKVYDFSLPEKAEREALWHLALLPFDPAMEICELSILLAESFAFSGSRIKSVVLNAYALGHMGRAGITIANLRESALNEARNNGRLPAKRELQKLAAFGAQHVREIVK